MDAANRCPGVLICRIRHGAGIEHDHVGLIRRQGTLQATLPELALQRRPICLGGAAAEILYVESAHTSIVT